MRALLTAFLLASVATASVAAPAPGSAVSFALECAECPPDAYCEFGYPGAPEGSVACVENAPEAYHSLYRRYASPWQACGYKTCISGQYLGSVTRASVADCQTYCDTLSTCTSIIFQAPSSCLVFASILSLDGTFPSSTDQVWTKNATCPWKDNSC
ncbi:hypothetical protein DFJ74DRAFT_753196 [Hyaloraphidium curvatum]|nr:hypothetical protein DFJ74DRAFT_753196 [Hyaloraphidium curvatum]